MIRMFLAERVGKTAWWLHVRLGQLYFEVNVGRAPLSIDHEPKVVGSR